MEGRLLFPWRDRHLLCSSPRTVVSLSVRPYLTCAQSVLAIPVDDHISGRPAPTLSGRPAPTLLVCNPVGGPLSRHFPCDTCAPRWRGSKGSPSPDDHLHHDFGVKSNPESFINVMTLEEKCYTCKFERHNPEFIFTFIN